MNAQHLMGRDVLRDADHGADARVDRLVDRVGGKPCRDEDQRRVRPRLLHGVGDHVEHRNSLDVLPGFPRRDARNHLRAVVAVAQTVETSFAAREALDD